MTTGAAVAAATAAFLPATAGAVTRRNASLAGGSAERPIAASTNWAGYAVTAAEAPDSPPPGSPSVPSSTVVPAFTSVTGTWTQPRVSCTDPGGSATYSAVWVGLGGLNSDAQGLEQIGTDADCTAAGKPRYFAWYELIPAPAIPLKLKIQPGDTITASVNANATGVLVQIKNRTRRTSFTRQLSIASPDLTSAEWIVEAPSACTRDGRCSVLPLANFGTVSFSRIATIGSGQPGTLANPSVSWLPNATAATGQ